MRYQDHQECCWKRGWGYARLGRIGIGVTVGGLPIVDMLGLIGVEINMGRID